MKISEGVVHKIPSDLKTAIISYDAIDRWEDISDIARNEWICWIEDAKKIETRKRRIERTCLELLKGKRRPCCWAGCSHRK